MTIPDEQVLSQLVSREVVQCASALVQHFASNPDACVDDVDYDNILNLCATGDDVALEHWIVSDWFGEKLAERGEIVGELFNFTIWGRCTSGQAICLDGVIRDIASEMEILPGQCHAWCST